jgi:DNA repair exonuclease SbcCD ATPase subunit/DNA repair exonuclease SbcCD nuclease subunit
MDTIILSLPNKKIKHVIHLSDIHIRTGDLEKSRYLEYEEVFIGLIESVSKLDILDDAILVITGDIFHHKGKIEPSGIKLAQFLLTSLLEYANVFMICGNHDYRQDNPTIPDMIESIYGNYINNKIATKHEAFYLNKTGYYHYNNIGFAVVDIKDTLKTYNTVGRNENLITFPSKQEFEKYEYIDYAIALFHGSILPSRLMNNLNIQNGYELEWFGDYEYIMLGDNHRMQWSLDNDKLWGYCGSLIQQDFGESFLQHGYFIWNLESKTIGFTTIFNNYGYCTVKETNDKLYAIINKRTLVELTNFAKFPKNVAFRVFSKDIIPKIESFCSENNITPSCIIHWASQIQTEDIHEKVDKYSTNNELKHIEELNTVEKWFEYLEKYTDVDKIRYFILHPELLKLPMLQNDIDFFKKYTERNDKIQKVIDEYISETTKVHKTAEKVKLINMSWAYLMCYGENNHFNFDTLTNSIALLNGKNAMGKSSFLDILCIALYGEPTKMRHLVNGKKYTDKIIHDQRPSHKIAPFVKVLFQIGDSRYEIYRSFGSQSAKTKEHLILQTNVQIYKIHSEIAFCKTLICEGGTLVDRWITENIGSMESILMSIMICQTDLNNFFHLKQDEQKTILDKALRLDTVSLYGRILKEAILAHTDILQQIKVAKQTVEVMFPAEYVCKSTEIETLLHNVNINIKDKQLWREEILTHITQIIKPIDIEVNIDFAFDEIQTDYIQTNLRTPISCEDNDLAIMYREKLENLDNELSELSEVSIIKDDDKHYKKWKVKYDKFLLKEPKCNVSMEWIKTTLEQFKEWNESQEYDYNIDEIEKKFIDVENKVLNFVKIEKPIKNCTDLFLDPSYILIDEEIFNEYVHKRNHLLESPLNKNRTLHEYTEWFNKYNAWKTSIESVENIDINKIKKKHDLLIEKIENFNKQNNDIIELEKNISTLTNDLNDIKHLEFNSDCWACNKNPFSIKKDALIKKHNECLLFHKNIQNKIIKSDLFYKWEDSLIKLKSIIGAYNNYFIHKDSYDCELEYWNNIIKSWEEYNKWKEELDFLNKKIKDYENYTQALLYKRYKEQEDVHAILIAEYTDIKHTFENAKKYMCEKKDWDFILKEVDKYKETYSLYEVWLEEQKIIQSNLFMYESSIKKRELEELKQNYLREYNLRKNNASISKRFEECKNMYYSNKLHIVDAQLIELTNKREAHMTEKAKTDAAEDIIKKHKHTFDKLLLLEEIYEERIIKIKNLELLFMGDKTTSDGYKEWIYKTQVIPLINKEMNAFLGMFENFSFEMTYDKKHFIYMLEDRGNKPTLDKASGYQNFITGLAFRIILTRIGAVGQQMKHLFIDEGFTACDSLNIEKVPYLLKSILSYGEYDSLILMSHLDSVRECTNIHININRDDPFSYINYSNEYPELSVLNEETGEIIKQKGRGRPKKTNLDLG